MLYKGNAVHGVVRCLFLTEIGLTVGCRTQIAAAHGSFRVVKKSKKAIVQLFICAAYSNQNRKKGGTPHDCTNPYPALTVPARSLMLSYQIKNQQTKKQNIKNGGIQDEEKIFCRPSRLSHDFHHAAGNRLCGKRS